MRLTDFSVARWRSADRLDELLAVVHAAFAGFDPPSSVLRETVADVAARQRDGLIIVAQADGAFIGSVFAAPKDGSLYVTRLAVLPAWRNRGVGAALMTAVENEARAAQCAKITLRVRISLPGNRAYFEKLGFAVIGRGQDDGRPPYDAMERLL